MLIEAGFTCAVCGEWNETVVDTEGSLHQTYTEDCFVCCHPNTLYITIDEAAERAYIDARFEE
jgi:hypothetical protein